MNPTDLVCLAILAVSAAFGLARGFAREVLGLLSWIGAAFGATLLFPALLPIARRAIENLVAAEAASWGVAFIGLLIVFSVLADLLARLVRRTPIGGIDRVLGVAFGVARGAAILVGAYVVGCLALPPSQWPREIRVARAAPIVFAGAEWAVTLIPPHSRPVIGPPNADAAPTSAASLDRPEPAHAA